MPRYGFFVIHPPWYSYGLLSDFAIFNQFGDALSQYLFILTHLCPSAETSILCMSKFLAVFSFTLS
jgi:hypothetical protein